MGLFGWGNPAPAPAVIITPPPQPMGGPGGSSLPYTGVSTINRTLIPNNKSYSIITPTGWTGGNPAPTSLPLVIFLHGYSFLNNLNTPAGYQSWISHIARQGNIVVFPRYQEWFDSLNGTNFTNNAIAALKDALAKPWPSIPADTSLGMLLVGHSSGCLLAANMAHRYSIDALPLPKSLVLAMPYQDASLQPLNNIPISTKLLAVVGANDSNVGRSGADAIWDRTNHLAERSYVQMFSDTHGFPVLTANHFVSIDGQSPLDALDWNGLWKFSDAMRNYALSGTDGGFVFGGGAGMTSLGNWSDGVPVKPMIVTTGKP